MIQIIYKNKVIRETKNNNFNALAFIKEFEKVNPKIEEIERGLDGFFGK